MAIFHLHAGFVSRSSGRTSVQSAAYICGEKLHEDHRDQDVDYTKRSHDVVCHNTIAPEHSKYRDLDVWNEIENFENRYAENYFKNEDTKNRYLESAQTAQTMVIALPNELAVEANKELIEKFIETRFASRNLVSTYAIHKTDSNMHAHIQISRRAIGEDGEFVKRKDREICSRSALLETRKLWADLANEYLTREGYKERITEKSFADLGIDLEATKHRGWYADSIGTNSRIAQENLDISRRNEEKILGDPSIILDYLNEKKAVFTQKDILREIGKRVFEDNKISAVFEKVLEEAQYIGEGINGEFLYTGERYQQLESDVLTKFEDLSSKTSQTICDQAIKNEVLSKYDYLSVEQKSAVVGLTGDSNFGILIGKAGAGKTTAIQAISEIYEQSGSRVIGMSLSAVASENLGKDAGIESATIASWAHRWRSYKNAQEKFLSFNSIVTDGVLKQLDWYNDLKRYERSQLKSGDVIVVDEAGMVGTSDWKTILDAAEKFGAKVIAVGDDNQFKAISSGDCFRQFIDQKQVSVLELSEIRRQKEDWQREASVEFSKLNAGEALAKYEHHGKLHDVEGSGIYSQIAEKYLEIEKIGTSAVLCSTRAECAAINDAVREFKRANGELCGDLVSLNARLLAKNDSIMFLQNDKQLDVKNGQVGVVQSFTNGILSIQTESGVRNINISEYDKIDHAYAITLHKSQGKTYDNTIVLANKMMDAKATYVGMTRHRENVDVYYNKSDFGSFKDLAASASKYSHKDSLEDYRSIENQNKARVFAYKETLLETASALRDIHRGEADWKEYHTLKSNSTNLGKEILGNYDSHKLYLDQLGITKEKLEIGVGLKQRPLSNVELNAKNTVALYAKAAQKTRSMFNTMKKEVFNVTKHRDYEKYCDIRGVRNDLAKEILSNYPMHREFVREISRDFFISKKSMENQVNYAERVGAGKVSERELMIRSEVAAYIGLHNRVEAMSRTLAHADSQKENHKYETLVASRNEQCRNILCDYNQYESALKKYEQYGITKDVMEKQLNVSAISDNSAERKFDIKEIVSSLAETKSLDNAISGRGGTFAHTPSSFLEKLHEHHKEIVKNVFYVSPEKLIEKAHQQDSLYDLNLRIHKEKYGYALHVSNPIMRKYINYNKLDIKFDSHISKHASLLAEEMSRSCGKEKPDIGVLDSCIKQALCFESLKLSQGGGLLSEEKIQELHHKSLELSKHISESNIHALNNREFMKEVANSKIIRSDVALSTENVNHLMQLNKEFHSEKQQDQQLHKQKDFELER